MRSQHEEVNNGKRTGSAGLTFVVLAGGDLERASFLALDGLGSASSSSSASELES